MKKTKLKIVSVSLMIVLLLSTSVIFAFLLFTSFKEVPFELGDVAVDIEAFYNDGTTNKNINLSDSNGVISLDITNPEELEHFNNFRVNIIVKSKVDTYFRVQVMEQFTLTYIVDGKVRVVAVTRDDYSKFNYSTDFYDNRLYDGFFYYKNMTKRVNETTNTVIPFIVELPEIDSHPIYESKYTIQIGFLVDAVQFLSGPEKNWGLPNKPWGGNW